MPALVIIRLLPPNIREDVVGATVPLNHVQSRLTEMIPFRLSVPDVFWILIKGNNPSEAAAFPVIAWTPGPSTNIKAVPPPVTEVLLIMISPWAWIAVVPVTGASKKRFLMPVVVSVPAIVKRVPVFTTKVQLLVASKTTLFRLWLPVKLTLPANSTVELLVETSYKPAT